MIISPELKFALMAIGITLGLYIVGIFHSFLVLYTPLFSKNRIQERPYKEGIFWKRLPLISFNIFLLCLVTLAGLYFGYDFFDHSGTYPLWLSVGQFLMVVFFDDLYFFFLHKFLHENKWALHKIHGIHHQAIMPFPLEFIYVHPAEWFLGSFGPFIGVLICKLAGYPIAEGAFLFYAFFRNLHELDIHSGVKSWFFKWIPIMAPAEHHDLHHSRPFGNYASMFVLWDKVFGTEVKPEEVKKGNRIK